MRNLLGAARWKLELLLGGRRLRRHTLVGPGGAWRMKREFQIRFLRAVGLRPGHVLVDIGSGTLRGGIPIIEYLHRGDYIGLESRSELLAEAQAELRELSLEHKGPVLVYGPDCLDQPLPRQADFVWAFSVLIHMPDRVVRECLRFVGTHLRSSGAMYANVNVGPEATLGNWSGFPVLQRPLEFYAASATDHALSVSDMGSLGSLGHVSGDASEDGQMMLRFVRGECTPASTIG